MSKIVIIFLFIIIFFCPCLVTAIIITEVQIEGESANECYIKLYNPSSSTIDVSGYNLRKKTSSGKDSSIRVFPSGSSINGNNYFIWASSRDEEFPEKMSADIISTQSLAKNNSIALMNKDKKIIDALAWGESENPYKLTEEISNPEKGQIIKRVKENDIYKITQNNSEDFTVYPPPPSPLQIKETIVEYGEKDETNPLLFAIISSLILSIIITYLNKKWQDTVTQKM